MDLFLQILILVHFHSPSSESHGLLLSGVFSFWDTVWFGGGGEDCSIFFVFIQAELLTWCIQMHVADEKCKL